jgi:isatin hydrolase
MMDNEFARVLGNAEIVDLTLTLDDTFPVTVEWAPPFRHVVHNYYVDRPGDPQPVTSTRAKYVQKAPDGTDYAGAYYSCWITMYEHSGTHFDAPVHAVPSPDSGLPNATDKSIYGEDVPLKWLQGPACVIDLRYMRKLPTPGGISQLAGVDVIKEWEKKNGEIKPGDIPILQTGWDEFYKRNPEGQNYLMNPFKYKTVPAWPAPTREAVKYLIDKGVMNICTDAPTLGGCQENFFVHWEVLSRGTVMVENLAHIEKLPARGAYFVFLPIKVARSSGCPGRAFAYVPKNAK